MDCIICYLSSIASYTKAGRANFLSLVTSRVDGIITILGVIKGREKANIKAFFTLIPKKKRKTITAVCCDMYDGYLNAAKGIFGASIPVVVDRLADSETKRNSLFIA